MVTARFSHTATLLPDGKVLVSGGSGSTDYLSNAEVYDLATGTWRTTGSLAMARYGHTATLLPSGKVLVSGGFDGNGASSGAEVYDPATGTWRTTGSMVTARYGHTATLLPDGRVLASRGPSAELYEDTGAQQAWRPVVLSVFQVARVLNLAGTGFRGVSEASGGGLSNSSTNVPLLTLQEANEETLTRLPFSSFSATSVRALLPEGLSGYYLVSVLPNAISGGKVAFIDTRTPAAPVVTAPENGALLNNASPVFSGTAEAGSTVMVSVQGSPVGTTTANASGAWSLTPSASLAQGTLTAWASAADAAGHTSPASTTVSFTVDTVAPAPPMVSAPENGTHVSTSTPTLEGTAEAGSTVKVLVDQTVIGSVVASATGTWRLTVPSPLGGGEHTATATATDAAGNTSEASQASTFSVSADAPPGGCGCASTSTGMGPGALWGLMLLLLVSRRAALRAG